MTPMIINEPPVVATESGSVQGFAEDGVAAFRGIPYAASPIGDCPPELAVPPVRSDRVGGHLFRHNFIISYT